MTRRRERAAFVVGEVVEAAVGRQRRSTASRGRATSSSTRASDSATPSSTPGSTPSTSTASATPEREPERATVEAQQRAPLADVDEPQCLPRRGSPTARRAAAVRARARRTARRARSTQAAIHCASCVCAPVASAVSERDVLAPTGNPLTRPGRDVGGAERHELAVGVDGFAALRGERARHQDAFGEHEQARARARRARAPARRASVTAAKARASAAPRTSARDARRRGAASRARATRRSPTMHATSAAGARGANAVEQQDQQR